MGDVVMVSGGLDSFLAKAKLSEATPLFIEWGQPYLGMERVAVADLYPGVRTVRVEGLPDLDPSDTYVAARNLLFACIAARFGSRVCLAGMRDEMCADKSPDAFKAMTAVLTAQCRSPVEVFSPFWSHTKSGAVREYLDAGRDPGLLLRTVSCYGSGASPCLDCEACFRRFVALRSNGLEVPRPSDAVVRTYGLHRVHGVPLETAHATLCALHASGTPVSPVSLEDVVADPGSSAPEGHVRVVFTSKRHATPELIQRTLSHASVRFDAVLTGVDGSFFDFL